MSELPPPMVSSHNSSAFRRRAALYNSSLLHLCDRTKKSGEAIGLLTMMHLYLHRFLKEGTNNPVKWVKMIYNRSLILKEFDGMFEKLLTELEKDEDFSNPFNGDKNTAF